MNIRSVYENEPSQGRSVTEKRPPNYVTGAHCFDDLLVYLFNGIITHGLFCTLTLVLAYKLCTYTLSRSVFTLQTLCHVVVHLQRVVELPLY